MTPPFRFRRAALLGIVLCVGACDVAQFVADPKPLLETTLALALDTTTISVASILPGGGSGSVTIRQPDSNAFRLSITSPPSISKRLGDADACPTACNASANSGSITMSATALSATTGRYTRTAGSFITDGFFPGERISASGFTNAGNNGPSTITSMTATTMDVTKNSMVNEGAAAARSVFGIKPNFSYTVSSSTALPADIVSASIAGGQIVLTLTNGMQFDPLRVNTAGACAATPASCTQGSMVVNIIGDLGTVIGTTTISGTTTTWAPASVLTRTINLLTGTVKAPAGIKVEVVMSSPEGDHAETLNPNGTLNASATIPTLDVASVSMNVTNQTMNSGAADTIPPPLSAEDAKHVLGGGIFLNITNPFAVNGSLTLTFKYGPAAGQTVVKNLTLPSASATPVEREIKFDSTEMRNVFTNKSTIQMTGTMNTAAGAPITVTPRQAVMISQTVYIKLLVGSLDNGGK